MNKQLQKQAEKIFREKFVSNWKSSEKGFEEWLKYNTRIYNEIIIPSIVQALENATNECEYKKYLEKSKEEWDSAMQELAEDRDRRRHEKSNGASKIQPGQKLKDGDYFECGMEESIKIVKSVYTREEVIELIDNLLQNVDALVDACTNEYTNHDAKSLMELSESINIQINDYYNGAFCFVTKEQADELWILAEGIKLNMKSVRVIMFHDNQMLWSTSITESCLLEHSFEDFKQLCINTFGDGK